MCRVHIFHLSSVSLSRPKSSGAVMRRGSCVDFGAI